MEMNEKSGMSEEDRQLWSRLLEWGVCRIAGYLNHMEVEEKGSRTWKREYSESILSLEIHEFFQGEGQKSLPALSDLMTEGGLRRLQKRLELDEFQLFCVILVMFSELDYHFEKLFVYLNNDWNQRLLSVEWAIRLFTMEPETNSSYLAYFLPGTKLERQVFDIRPEGQGSGLRRGLKLKMPILEFLLCSGGFPDRSYIKWNPRPEHLQMFLEEEVCRYLEGADREGKEEGTVFCLQGEGRQESLAYPIRYAEERGQALCVLDYRRMEEELEPEQMIQVLEMVMLAEGILCICHPETRQEPEKNARRFSAFLQHAAEKIGVIFLLEEGDRKGRISLPEVELLTLPLSLPQGSRKLQLWKRLAAGYSITEEILQRVSEGYEFGMQEIRQSLREAKRLAYVGRTEEISASMLHKACRRQLEYNLKEWAVLVEGRYQWEDLILPEEQKERLKEAINQIIYRQQVYKDWGLEQTRTYGTGLMILLTGPPGTGKTMAAQVLAGALEMELYKIQLPAVVSKYIGETEQNLRRIFQEGKKSRGVLFFDEADVLFSKRTEVKDSHDKYSNMEAAYMLQNMEEYTGVVILATNFPQNIDEAFKRRITYTIEFYLPDYEQRYRIWQHSIPAQLPLDADVNLEMLAERFELSGSNIKNIVVNAAFLAAAKQEPVGMEHFLKAIEGEYRKSGKYLTREELMQ